MPPGTYTLLLCLEEELERDVGALGERRFQPGTYAYTGSAFGPGGLDARLDRHRRRAAGGTDTCHWHVDYLLPLVEFEAAFTAPEQAVECAVARALPGDRVAGFGASDCGCGSHLAVTRDGATLRRALEGRYGPPADGR